MLDISSITAPAPDFSEAIGIRYPNPPASETPQKIRSGVSRLSQFRDRRAKLGHALEVLHEMLYQAECPEDFFTIAELVAEVRAELARLDAPAA